MTETLTLNVWIFGLIVFLIAVVFYLWGYVRAKNQLIDKKEMKK